MTSPHVQAFIARWHELFERDDPELIVPLFADDVEFFSPAIFAPKQGKHQVFELLRTVFEIFEGYRVTDTWTRGNEVLFEFEARVGKYTLQGIDRFVLDDDGRVAQMKVWIRPMTGMKELARRVMRAEVERRLAGRSAVSRLLYRGQLRAAIIFKSVADGFK
ncbi:MAG: nuclear transport factor 2 family protein [Gammaproteobacteria bacterium]